MFMWSHLSVFRLDGMRTGTEVVPSPILISTLWFVISTTAFRNSSTFAFSVACSTATEMNEMREYRTIPWLAKTTQHISTADCYGLLSDVSRLVATEHVGNKCSLLKSLCVICSWIVSKLINILMH